MVQVAINRGLESERALSVEVKLRAIDFVGRNAARGIVFIENSYRRAIKASLDDECKVISMLGRRSWH